MSKYISKHKQTKAALLRIREEKKKGIDRPNNNKLQQDLTKKKVLKWS